MLYKLRILSIYWVPCSHGSVVKCINQDLQSPSFVTLTSHFASLCLSFLFWKMGIIVIPALIEVKDN